MSPARTPEENEPVPSAEDERKKTEVSRRTFLQWGALAGASAPVAGLLGTTSPAAAQTTPTVEPAVELVEATIAELQEAMTRGGLTSRNLVDMYLDRIRELDQSGPEVFSVLEVNPDARRIARRLDRERRNGNVRGPLHGIPILLKDNIDTGDRMETTAGSLALSGAPAPQDSTVAARLRAAGAVILGKANLSEWANFRGFGSSSGWSGKGGQTKNPYVLDRNPCGSSSGSAAAVSANFVTVALGTETDGSIVCPSHINGVVGIKPTVGLTSRAGVVPISHTQDTVGPHGRTVADAAAVLGALVGVDPRDPATARSAGNFHTDYTQFLDPDGLRGARIGVPRGGGFWGYSRHTDAIAEEALEAMRDAGAVIIDEAEIPTIDQLNADDAEIIVLIYEFKRDLNAYLATRTGVPANTLAEVIEFNLEHAGRELKWFGQEFLELAELEIFSEEDYLAALERGPRLAGLEGIDAILRTESLDALFAPTGSPAWTTDPVNGDHFLGASSGPAAVAGYPVINVPAGHAFGLPVGVSFFSTAWSEPTLIKIASGFEAVTRARQAPTFRPTIPFDEPVGNAFNGITADPAVKHGGHGGEIHLQRLMKSYARVRKIFHSL
ncbi:MAG TPA: amidase [Thermoanaerobaculia bacterium]|nr:amidase [Thermoanaerobaculia bacterium]